MDDLKFPEGDMRLPPPKRVPFKAYAAFVFWHLNRLGPEKRRSELARRPLPSGSRFRLFPE